MKYLILILLISTEVFAQVHQPQGTVQIQPFSDKTGFIFMPDALECTFLKSTDGTYKESTCDYTMLYTAKMDGIKIFLKDHAWGDYAYLTVHHPVGDTEVGRFGTKIMFDDSQQDQHWIETSYDAELSQYLKIRLHYFTKSQAADIKAILNLRLHKVVP